jgi:hypothetical protein
MDKVRLQPAYQVEEFPESPGVCRRPYSPLQMRHYVNGDAVLPTRACEKTFFSRGDDNLKVPSHRTSQAEHVALCPTTPRLSDDVKKPRLGPISDGSAHRLHNFADVIGFR